MPTNQLCRPTVQTRRQRRKEARQRPNLWPTPLIYNWMVFIANASTAVKFSKVEIKYIYTQNESVHYMKVSIQKQSHKEWGQKYSYHASAEKLCPN